MGKSTKFTAETGAKAGKKSARARKKKRQAEAEIPAAASAGPPLPTNASERQKLLDEAIAWAAQNAFGTVPPTEVHKMMHEMRKRDPNSFLRHLFGTDKSDAGQDFDDGDESEYLANIDKLLADVSATTARNQKLMRLLEAWESRLVATQHRAEQPTELWMELAAIFRAPLRRDGAALSPGSQSPLVQPPTGTSSASPAR